MIHTTRNLKKIFPSVIEATYKNFGLGKTPVRQSSAQTTAASTSPIKVVMTFADAKKQYSVISDTEVHLKINISEKHYDHDGNPIIKHVKTLSVQKNDNVLFRGDGRPPHIIFKEGFQNTFDQKTYNITKAIDNKANDSPVTGEFGISLTANIHIAERYTSNNGGQFIYITKPDAIINLHGNLQESISDTIKTENIIAAVKLTSHSEGGKPIATEILLNPKRAFDLTDQDLEEIDKQSVAYAKEKQKSLEAIRNTIPEVVYNSIMNATQTISKPSTLPITEFSFTDEHQEV